MGISALKRILRNIENSRRNRQKTANYAKTGFLPMVRQEKANAIGYKFRFTHLNRYVWSNHGKTHDKIALSFHFRSGNLRPFMWGSDIS